MKKTETLYTQDMSAAFDDMLGNSGARNYDFFAAFSAARKAVSLLYKYKKLNSRHLLNIPEREDDLALIKETATRIHESFDTLVVLGMGASSRGGSALVSLAHNAFTQKTGNMRIHFVDNADPFVFEQLVSHIPLQTTAFLVISKSGTTAETLAQCMVLVNEVKKRIGENAIKDHFIFITEQGMNPLCRMGEELDILVIHHDRGISERFAALTAVGLLPAAVAGLDIHAIRYGAAQVVKHTVLQDSAEPVLGAALHDALLKKGKSVSIMVPGCNRLDAFGVWHQQLWAESLGGGGHGTTAMHVPGVCDQHSQLQLCLEGAQDKFVTLICLKQEGAGAVIPPVTRDRSLSYLKGHSLGNIAAAGQIAAVKMLTENNCPLRVFILHQMDEKTIGALMMHFMLETLIVAQLWNADALSRPVVEESRKLIRDCLSAGTLKQDMLEHPRKMRMAV